MLGGLLMGLGLGALLSWMGVGAGMANMISMLLVLAIIFGAVALIRRWLARGRRPAYAGGVPDARDTASAMYAGGVPVTPEIGSGLTRAPASGMGQSTADSAFADTDDGVPWSVPEGFDVASLLRAAKENYVRIQSAWDSGKVDAIRDLLTPQIFSEMSMQLYGRGSAENVTEVLSLDARLLGVETIGADYFASVKLSGSVRESKEASAEPFCEVWNLERSVSGVGEWKLAGVQQLS